MEAQEAAQWVLSPVTSCAKLYNGTASNLFQSITYFPLETFFFFPPAVLSLTVIYLFG